MPMQGRCGSVLLPGPLSFGNHKILLYQSLPAFPDASYIFAYILYAIQMHINLYAIVVGERRLRNNSLDNPPLRLHTINQ